MIQTMLIVFLIEDPQPLQSLIVKTNYLYILTLQSLKTVRLKNINSKKNLIESNELKSNIIDVNKLTKSISIDSIKLLILNELSSKTEEIQLYSDVFDKREELIESWQNPNTYEDNELLGLEEREKGEKLTFDQIKKLKELMTDSEM